MSRGKGREMRALVEAARRMEPFLEDHIGMTGLHNMPWKERVAVLGLLRASRRLRT